jgi:hypothetical protein
MDPRQPTAAVTSSRAPEKPTVRVYYEEGRWQRTKHMQTKHVQPKRSPRQALAGGSGESDMTDRPVQL